MSLSTPRGARLADFNADRRVLLLLILALPIGLLAVLAGWLLLHLIALCTNLAYHGVWSWQAADPDPARLGPLSVLVPVAGCLVIGLMARYGSEKIRGHGIPEAMEAILIGQSRISPKVAVLKPLSSAVSIGTGGPFGAEGPVIMTGGAIGSLLAQTLHLTSAERKSLLVAGAAAGMTAIFGTPLAAILLAVELLLFEWKPRSFLPVAAAALLAATVRPWLLNAAPLFPFAAAPDPALAQFPGWVAVGIGAGLGAGVLTLGVYAVEDLFERLPLHWMWWPALGGLAIGLGGLLDPAALGVGYDNIRQMLSGNLALQAALSLLLVKLAIWTVSLGSGTSGGVLAPLLIFGGAMGTLAAPWLPPAAPGFWALLGMAAMMGGTMRAPLTATLFALELSGNLSLLLPVAVACTTAYGMSVLLLRRSILTEKIARRGLHLTREYHVDPLQVARVADIMRAPVQGLAADMDSAAAQRQLAALDAAHTAYPVLDAAGIPLGWIRHAQALAWGAEDIARRPRLRDMVAGQVPALAYPGELGSAIADRMAGGGPSRVAVVDRESGRMLGMVARSDLFIARQRRLIEESIRQAPLRRRQAE